MFELANPWVLWFIPLPFLIWLFLPRAILYLPAALRVPFFNAMQRLIDEKQQGFIGHSQSRLMYLIWLLILIALAGPRWVGEPIPLSREGRNIMLVLDLSGSMEQTDMLLRGRPVSRLTVVKQTASQFVEQRVADRIGLILFGSRAYLQTPLTYDRRNVLMRIEDATAGLAGRTTSLGDALGLAVKRLQNVPPEGRVIILLTDGANNSGVLTPIKAAELAQLDRIKVYTIGLGADVDPNLINGPFSAMNSSDLDEDTLQEIAKLTGGQYFRATDGRSLDAIYATINQLETVKQEEATVRPQRNYYPWPAGFALLLLFLWFYWKMPRPKEGRS